MGESEKKDPSDDPDETPTERAVNGDRQDAKNQLKNGKLKTPKTEPVHSSEQGTKSLCYTLEDEEGAIANVKSLSQSLQSTLHSRQFSHLMGLQIRLWALHTFLACHCP